jgi:hypothetical protein
MNLKNLQSCQHFGAGLLVGIIVAGLGAWAWLANHRQPCPGRFTLLSPSPSTLARTDSATGEVVLYLFAAGSAGAYRISDLPITGRDPASFPS